MPHEDIFRRRLSVIILSVASDRKPDLNRLKQKREHAGRCTQAVQGRCGALGWLQVSLYSSLKSYSPGPAVSFSQVSFYTASLPFARWSPIGLKVKSSWVQIQKEKEAFGLALPGKVSLHLMVSDWIKSLPLNQSYGQCCMIC